MVIQNSTRTYVVLRQMESNTIRQYLCRQTASGEEAECRIAVVPNQYAPDLIPYLEDQREEGKFTDLLDFFTDESSLYIVTAATSFASLESRLGGAACSLAERMTIMKNLLEALLLQGMDDFFCCAALKASDIGVSDALEIGLQYDLDGIIDHGQSVFVMTQYRLAGVVRVIFRNELEQQSLPELMELEERLKQGTFSSLLEVYGWFLPVAELWSNRKEDDLRPMSFWFRVWEWLKLLAGKLVWLWKLVLILLAAGYLIVSVKMFFAEPAVSDNYKEIGTLTIE